MKKITIIILCILISFCLKGQNKLDIIIEKFNGIENWHAEIKKGITDTTGIKNWIPDAELTVTLQNNDDPDCLKPIYEFYPINLKDYILKKLYKYLILRSTLYPTGPKSFETDGYLILGWNLIIYDNDKKNGCSSYSDLERQIINLLELKIGNYPNIEDLKVNK